MTQILPPIGFPWPSICRKSRAGDGIRTHDVQLGNVARADSPVKQDNDLGRYPPALARCLHTDADPDPDLARVVKAWPDLPPHIKAAVLALVQTAPSTGRSDHP